MPVFFTSLAKIIAGAALQYIGVVRNMQGNAVERFIVVFYGNHAAGIFHYGSGHLQFLRHILRRHGTAA